MTTTLLCVAAVALCAAPAYAQSTATEHQAAAPVLQSIGALEARLQPARLAQRLASASDPGRDRMLERVGAAWAGEMQALSDWIGKHPEVGWHEEKAVDTLTKVLRAEGYRVEAGVAGLKTAFVASWDSPAGANGPTLGLIGEYDALRGTQGAFHGDQHNAQTPVALAAALGLRAYMTEHRVPGRIVVYGTPAEEVGPPAKTIMWKAGVFKGADILVRSHSTGGGTGRSQAGFGDCCLNISQVKYIFKGRPSHQLSSWNGRNALEAAVMFYTAVDRLRSSLRPEASIQGVIPEGGVAPNVVPDRAVVDYYIRYPDEVYLEHIDSMMAHAARGAAEATGTTVELQPYGEYRDGISLGTLEELKYAWEKKLGAPKLLAEPGRPDGYEETGFVTRDIPGVGVTAYSSRAPNHTYGMLEDDFTDIGHTGFVMDAKVMAAVLYDFLTHPELRAAVREEHKALSGMLTQYLTELKKTYGPEVGSTAAN